MGKQAGHEGTGEGGKGKGRNRNTWLPRAGHLPAPRTRRTPAGYGGCSGTRTALGTRQGAPGQGELAGAGRRVCPGAAGRRPPSARQGATGRGAKRQRPDPENTQIWRGARKLALPACIRPVMPCKAMGCYLAGRHVASLPQSLPTSVSGRLLSPLPSTYPIAYHFAHSFAFSPREGHSRGRQRPQAALMPRTLPRNSPQARPRAGGGQGASWRRQIDGSRRRDGAEFLEGSRAGGEHPKVPPNMRGGFGSPQRLPKAPNAPKAFLGASWR